MCRAYSSSYKLITKNHLLYRKLISRKSLLPPLSICLIFLNNKLIQIKMDFFRRAKVVRLKSQHHKFLYADEDEESVKQQSNGATTSARWTVEFVEGKPDVIRLKSSRSWKYLSASDEPFLLGWTGKRVMQASPRLKSDACVEWEPIKEGLYVKLRARRGTFLRANGRIPPWRNSVTHDMPSTTQSQNSVLWIVDVLEIDHSAEVATEEKVVNDRPDLKKDDSNYSFASSGGVEEELTRMSSVNSNTSGGRIGSPARSVRSVRTPSPPHQDSFSRSSSSSSNAETPVSSYAATPASSERTEVSSPYIQKLKNNSSKNSRQSNSFVLESAIADASKLLDGRNQKKKNNSEDDHSPEPVYSYTSSRPLALEIRMAKKTLTEAKDLDFESVISSGRLIRIEKAIKVLASNEAATKRSGNTKISSLQNQFQSLSTDREKAVIDLEEYEAYGEKKAEIKEGLQREVGKARELQQREAELCEVLDEARRRREELARELERVDNEIREAEEKQAENEAEIEEVCTVIKQRNDGVKEMEREEETWRRRKTAAERRLRQVEEDWGLVKGSLAVVRLRSHGHKYLVAGNDGETVRQSRQGNTSRARWTVEIVDHGGRITIRLQSCHGKYLSASDDAFLLGATGKKAVLATPATEADVSVEWEPIREGFQVKLRSRKGKFLRANRGPPPYKGSVTVDEPTKKTTMKWVLWGVDILETEEEWAEKRCNSRVGVLSEAGTQRFNSSGDSEDEDETEEEDDNFSVCGSSMAGELMDPRSLPSFSTVKRNQSWMELFRNAKTVRLRNRHDKYLFADDDMDKVTQDRHGDSKRARWTVEYVKSGDGVRLVRLKSCYDKYLTATDEPFLLGATGKKVKQRIPRRLDSSVDWEPFRDGMQVKFKTRYGNYLRANGGLPPWRNSITHDVPTSSITQDSIFWSVDVLEVYPPEKKVEVKPVEKEEVNVEEEDDGTDPEPFMHQWMKSSSRTESSVRFPISSAKNEGRAVLYNVVDDDGNVSDEGNPHTLNFKGSGLQELKEMLEEMTELQDIIVCARNPLNDKLYPLCLALPPQHVKLHVFVVPRSSKG
ncbi:hypothetical protein V2J09_024174 [Rumex salicifolius]